MLRKMLMVLVTSSALLTAQAGLAKTCKLAIEGNDAMQFNHKEMTVEKGCTEVEVTLKHVGKLPKTAMGHNWVLTKASDMSAVATAGIQAGVAGDYLPKNDKRVVAATKLIGGGETASVKFKVSELKKGTEYKYFCTFPGHSSIMVGTLKF